MLSEAPSGTAATCVVAEPVWVASDPDPACEARRRGVRWRLRAGLFASPLSAFAGLIACLRVCLLAIVFVLCIRIAPVAMLTPPQARRSGPGGRRPGGGRRRRQQCFLRRGSRAQCDPRQRFFAGWPASYNAAARRRPVRCLKPAKATVSDAASLLALGQLRSEAVLTTFVPCVLSRFAQGSSARCNPGLCSAPIHSFRFWVSATSERLGPGNGSSAVEGRPAVLSR